MSRGGAPAHHVGKSVVTASIARALEVITSSGTSFPRVVSSAAVALSTSTASRQACVDATAQSGRPTRAWDLTPPKLQVRQEEIGWHAPWAAPGQKRR